MNEEWANELDQGYSGNGLRQGNCSGDSGAWIYNPPPYWSDADYVRAVLLRGNLLPTRRIPSNPPHERRCRAGCERTESLCHVLQKCLASYWPRIRRHDNIVSLVRRIAEKKGWVVHVEARIRCSNQIQRIPDLVLEQGDRVVILDVAVTWKGPSSMSVAVANKKAKYTDPYFLEALQTRYPGRIIVVAPLVVGARGIWCRDNRQIARILDLSSHDIKRLRTHTLIGGVAIHRHIMTST